MRMMDMLVCACVCVCVCILASICQCRWFWFTLYDNDGYASVCGFPMGALFKSMAAWDGGEERLCKRLAIWKKTISEKEGKLL